MSFLNNAWINTAVFFPFCKHKFAGIFVQSMKSFWFNHAAKLQKLLSQREWKHWVAAQGKRSRLNFT